MLDILDSTHGVHRVIGSPDIQSIVFFFKSKAASRSDIFKKGSSKNCRYFPILDTHTHGSLSGIVRNVGLVGGPGLNTC